LSLACLALFAAGRTGLAQTKVAVVDLQKAVLDSAEIKKASADMEAKYRPRQAALEKLQKEIQGLQQRLQTEGDKLTPGAVSDLTAQGQQKQRDAQRMTEDLQADVNAERQYVLTRSTQKMQAVIRKLAEEKGFDLVVDAANTLFFKPAMDLTADALAAFNQANPVK
jgi:outer membrane protein